MKLAPLLAVLLAPSFAACTWETALPDEATSIAIAEQELLVTEDAPGFDALASELALPRALGGAGLDAAAVDRWLATWEARLARPSAAGLRASSFDLAAVVNRVDLADQPDRKGDGGELRLVYAARDRATTVILEYALDGPAATWAERWHREAAGALAREVVATGRLAQVRTADAEEGPLVMHELALEAGELAPARVRNSPDWHRVGREAAAAYGAANGSALEAGNAVMPVDWWAESATLGGDPAWLSELPNGELVRRQTCGGCHALSETGFQIDPRRRGRDRLSTFLRETELPRRRTWMQLTLWRSDK